MSLFISILTVIASPARAVAKYCDEHACLSVCLPVPQDISGIPEPHARSLPIYPCVLPMAVARSSSGSVTKSQGKGQFSGFSSPLTMYCNAFAVNGIGRRRGWRECTAQAKCDLRLPCFYSCKFCTWLTLVFHSINPASGCKISINFLFASTFFFSSQWETGSKYQ